MLSIVSIDTIIYIDIIKVTRTTELTNFKSSSVLNTSRRPAEGKGKATFAKID
eukprot:SAG31_NODE_88_length_26714_cov_6.972046_19_plen_53_part_00